MFPEVTPEQVIVNKLKKIKLFVFFSLCALGGDLFFFFKDFKMAEELVNPCAAWGEMKKSTA